MFTKYMIRQKTIVTIPTPRDRDTSALVRTVRVSTLDSFPSFLAFSNLLAVTTAKIPIGQKQTTEKIERANKHGLLSADRGGNGLLS